MSSTPDEEREAWRPSGVVTLLTDFGQRDPYVGIMKGVLLARAPRAVPVDLTHEVAPQDVAAAAFYLRHAWRWFPDGTVHVAVVDPGVGSARRILLARAGGHTFLAPDNGLLPGALDAPEELREVDLERFSLPDRSATFHGRDVFAPTAARLATGLAPSEVGAPADDPERVEAPGPRPTGDGGWEAHVVLVDRFGNLVTDLTAAELDPREAGRWRVQAGAEELALCETYADAARGAALSLLDSFGCWEIAVRDGDAARRLQLGPGATVLFQPMAPGAAPAGR